ncbi:sensory neuron membrane protein 2 [Maniola hyperantus]|uniref:sensory neuron membrane protein 2 n=1 Tax=Aphantopus hyperantus TaxID=2795564 RepID=UPI003749F60A
MYRKKEYLEFDAETSFPLSLDDEVTVVNVAYHNILQMAETLFPPLMALLPLALGGVFGVHNSPIMTVRVGDLLFDGIPICKNPGFIGAVACNQIKPLAADVRNIDELEDGSLEFSILRFKHDRPSDLYVASRGVDDVTNLGVIRSYNGSSHLNFWVNPATDEQGGEVPSVCNMLNGTDAGIFPPFVNRDEPLYAFNTDVCRSAELRYQYDTSYKGIPAARFAANDWFLDNHQGCFCLNKTRGINRDDGCLLPGAIEMFSCIGALMVLSYPHFLYADFGYRNGLIGMRPDEEQHRLFVDLEPNTGTVVRGMKRAQFNVFMRPVTAIPATQPLRTTLMPILWVEEGMDLPDDFVDMVKNRLLANLRLVDILVPVVIALSCLVLVLGVIILVRVKTRSPGTPHRKNIQLTN